MIKYILFAMLFLNISCETAIKTEEKKYSELPSIPKTDHGKCKTEEKKIKLRGPKNSWSKEVVLPAEGSFVGECHYITTEDTQISSYPKSLTDRIQDHLDRECLIAKSIDKMIDCKKIVKTKYDKCWTPAEGGKIGEGSLGIAWQRKNLTPKQEMFGMNMMWDKGERPKPGTKFLLSANGKNVVAYAGHETGPGSEKRLGGISSAAHFFLGTNNNSKIKISYLSDQSIDVGPIDCEN